VLDVGGLIGNEESKDQIVDCGCAPHDAPDECKSLGGGNGGNGGGNSGGNGGSQCC